MRRKEILTCFLVVLFLSSCAAPAQAPEASDDGAAVFFRIAPELNVEPIANDAALLSLQNEIDGEPGWTPAAIIDMLKTMELTAGEISYILRNLEIDWEMQAQYVAKEIMDSAPAGGEGRAYYLMMQEGYTEDEIREALTTLENGQKSPRG